MKLELNKLGTVSVAATVGLLVGAVFMPALADTLNPNPSGSPTPNFNMSASPTPMPSVTSSSDASDQPPTDEPTEGATPEPTWTPSIDIVEALQLEYLGSVYVRIADVYNDLCLDEGDYVHVADAIAQYTAMGDAEDAQLYQDRLSEHNALVASSNEQLAVLQDRLNNFVNTSGWRPADQSEAVYQAKLERARLEASIVDKLTAARDGLVNAQSKGLDISIWQNQITALNKAQSAFTRSRSGF